MVQPAAAADIALPLAPPPIRSSLVSMPKGPGSEHDVEHCMGVSSSSSSGLPEHAVHLTKLEVSESRRSSNSSNPPAPSTPPAPDSTSGCAAANLSPFACAAAHNTSGACDADDMQRRGNALLARLQSQASGGCVAATTTKFAGAAAASGACDLARQSSTLLSMPHGGKSGGCLAADSSPFAGAAANNASHAEDLQRRGNALLARMHSMKSGGCVAADSSTPQDNDRARNNSGSVVSAALPSKGSGGCVAASSSNPQDANARAALALLTVMKRPKSSQIGSQPAAVGLTNGAPISCEDATRALRAMLLRC
jgi:hypothetical protein